MKLQLFEDINWWEENTQIKTSFPFEWIRDNLASDISETLSYPDNIREEDEI